MLRLMRPRIEQDVNLEAARKGSQKPHANAEANERRHAAVRDRRREADKHVAIGVIDRNVLKLSHIELLERQGMLGIIDAPDQI